MAKSIKELTDQELQAETDNGVYSREVYNNEMERREREGNKKTQKADAATDKGDITTQVQKAVKDTISSEKKEQEIENMKKIGIRNGNLILKELKKRNLLKKDVTEITQAMINDNPIFSLMDHRLRNNNKDPRVTGTDAEYNEYLKEHFDKVQEQTKGMNVTKEIEDPEQDTNLESENSAGEVTTGSKAEMDEEKAFNTLLDGQDPGDDAFAGLLAAATEGRIKVDTSHPEYQRYNASRATGNPIGLGKRKAVAAVH